jgi:hypothetical protein
MTLLPALLGLCGDGIERLRVGKDRRPTLGHSALWERWGERLARRPGLFAVASVALLLAVATPVMGLGLGMSDQSSAPTSTTSRQAYDLMTESFGAGSNGPLLVTADLGAEKATGADDPRLVKLHDALAATDGVAAAGAPQVSKDGTAGLINVIPEGSPISDATSELVDEVRDSVIPGSGVHASVGGSTAQQLDLADLIGTRLPLIIAVVVGLCMLLLLVAFRSVIVPLQAAVVNLLSVGAAYGIVTAVFQDGHGATAIGLDGAIPIVSYVPIIMFAILFGLAMDYQVFLLSKVREEIDAGKSPRRAVIDGLAGTGKVIASAAAIHGRGLRELRRLRRSHSEGVRRRARVGDPDRRQHGLRPAARRDAAHGPPHVVAAAPARPRPAAHQRRGPQGPGRPDARAAPGLSVSIPDPTQGVPMSEVQTTTPAARSSLLRWTAGGTGLAAVLAAVAIAAWPASAADTARVDGERVGEAVVQLQDAQTTEEVDAALTELDAAVNEARSHAGEELDEQITDQADALDRTVDGLVGAVTTDDEFEAELYEMQLDDAVNDLAGNAEDFREQGPEVHDAFWEGVEDGLAAS